MAAAQALIGQNKFLLGRGEETQAHVQEALRLSPRDTWAYGWLWFVGPAKIAVERPEEAIVWLQRSIDVNPNYPPCRFILAAALARLGRVEDARSEVEAGKALDPRFTIASFPNNAWSDSPLYLAQREHIIEGLRKSGVPEE